ncbi:MAG: PEGA domain-containing protein [Deltaproteobacteria bacterium]|nr:PEGA domain-containing protein [Deltaproteobacteria bacterium]
MDRSRRFFGCALALALVAWQPLAGAQPRRRPARPQPAAEPVQDDATQRAREAYDRGRTQFAAQQYREALAAFQAAYDAKPHPTVLISIAECQERLEDFRAAVATLERYLADSPEARDRQQVQERIAAHRTRPAKINVTSEPAGAAIGVDGSASGQVTPATIEIAPGAHTISLTLEGYENATQEITVEFAERRDLPLTLQTPVPEEPELPPEPAPVEEARTGGETAPVWVAAGVAGVGLVAGAVLGFLALSDRSDFDDKPTVETADRGERFALFADIAFGVGIAAAVTTAVLYFTRSESAESSEGEDETELEALRLRLTPLAARNGAGVQAHLRF